MRDWPLIRRHIGVLIYLSLIGGGIFGALQFVGLQLTTALNVSVMNSLGPVFIVAASAAMFGDRLTGGQLAGSSYRCSACWRSSPSSIPAC